MYEEDLVLNNLQWLICHKTKPKHSEHQFCFITEFYTRKNCQFSYQFNWLYFTDI